MLVHDARLSPGQALSLLAVTEGTLGIDIGGTGIKAALVDTSIGKLLTERLKVATPRPSTPPAVVDAALELVGDLRASTIGIGFPAVVDPGGIVRTAMNIDPGWLGVDVVQLFSDRFGRRVTVLNDADAAAVAEARFGAAAGTDGLVIVITFGTGIGSGFLFHGELVPNVELGAMELDGHYPAEDHFSGRVREVDDLTWDEWGSRANRFLGHVDRVFTPELIVLGGGIAKHWELFADQLDEELQVVPATMGNSAGIVGAALSAI